MKVFVISLASAIARRQFVAEQFAELDVDFEFFEAVPASASLRDHFDELDADTYRLNTLRAPLASEIACFASHRSLWKYAARHNEPILILEDDAALDPHFAEALIVTERIIRRYGFIRLQTHERRRRFGFGLNAYRCLDIDSFALRYLSNVPLCLLAYAISPQAGAHLARASKKVDAPVDKFIQRTWDHQTPIFALGPPSVTTSHHASRSTIGPRPNKSRNVRLRLQRARYKFAGELSRMKFDKAQRQRLLHPDGRSDYAATVLVRDQKRDVVARLKIDAARQKLTDVDGSCLDRHDIVRARALHECAGPRTSPTRSSLFPEAKRFEGWEEDRKSTPFKERLPAYSARRPALSVVS